MPRIHLSRPPPEEHADDMAQALAKTHAALETAIFWMDKGSTKPWGHNMEAIRALLASNRVLLRLKAKPL